MIQGFYFTVHFSRQFGDGLVAEPVIEFTGSDEAHYTLQQRGMSGAWKDLLFAMLANFSHEVVGIRKHDGSHTFDPTHHPTTMPAKTIQDQPVPAVRESPASYETEPPEPSGAQEE